MNDETKFRLLAFAHRHWDLCPWVFFSFVTGLCVPDRFVNNYTMLALALVSGILGGVGLMLVRWHSKGDA